MMISKKKKKKKKIIELLYPTSVHTANVSGSYSSRPHKPTLEFPRIGRRRAQPLPPSADHGRSYGVLTTCLKAVIVEAERWSWIGVFFFFFFF